MHREHTLHRHLRNAFAAVTILALSISLGFLFDSLGFKEVSIYTEFILGILLVAVLTADRLYSAMTSICGILIFNYLFAEPRLSFRAANYGYPVDFIVLLAVSLLISTLAYKSEQLSFRTRTLLQTDQLFLQANGTEQIISITANQLQRLLNRPLVFFMADNGTLQAPRCFGAVPEPGDDDRTAAQWTFTHALDSGKYTEHYPASGCCYMPIRTADHIFGVAGIALSDKKPLSDIEKGLMRSLLNECALTLERDFYARQRQEAAVQMRNEKLRADLLRSISHDLRTPLTAISGNASLLSERTQDLSEAQRRQLAHDIGQDAQWLLGTVENLLAVTRIEDGRMNLKLQPEMVSDVLSEALANAQRYLSSHTLHCELEDDMLMARMDARLILQVLFNLIDNAAKHTPAGSTITVRAARTDGRIAISVIDDGPGVPDAHKSEVFEMFYTTSAGSIDGRRGLGLGLALCKAIVSAHGGEITLTDQTPHGAVFTFTLTEERIDLP